MLKDAINPKQYDSEDILWNHDVNANITIQDFYFQYLMKYKKEFIESDILEIGAGNGWLVNLLLNKAKLNSIECIEPSIKNNVFLDKIRNLIYSNSDLSSFKSNKKFDFIISVMVFGHIHDLELAFNKLKKLLKENGSILLIVSAYEYYTKKKEGWDLEVEPLNENESLIQIKNNSNKICEIVRKVHVYTNIAQNCGLNVKECIPMVPSQELIKLSPRIAEHKGKPLTYLIRIENNENRF